MLFQRIKKIITTVGNFISPIYNFAGGASSPGLAAFVVKFWLNGLQRDNEKEPPLITTTPTSVRLFMGGMVIYGILNVLLNNVYLARKEKHLNQAKADQKEINEISERLFKCVKKIKEENRLLESFQGLIVETKESHDNVQLMFLEKNNVSLNSVYSDPQFKEEVEKFERMKLSTRVASKYISNKFLTISGTAALTLFAATTGFAVPVALALTTSALVQDLSVLPFGHGIMYIFIGLGLLSSLSNAAKTFNTVYYQKKDEKGILHSISDVCAECVIKMNELRESVATNAQLRKKLREIFQLGTNKLIKTSAYEFQLFSALPKLHERLSALDTKQVKEEEQVILDLEAEQDNAEYGSVQFSKILSRTARSAY